MPSVYSFRKRENTKMNKKYYLPSNTFELGEDINIGKKLKNDNCHGDNVRNE